MISRALKLKCDICGIEEFVEEPADNGWCDFRLDRIMDDVAKNRKPSNFCPYCADKLRKYIYHLCEEERK